MADNSLKMYNIVDGLQGGLSIPKPRFQRVKKPEPKQTSSVPCYKIFFRKVKTLFLRLRASVLIILASFGIPGFYLSLHFLLNPGLATLEARFQPATCVVVSSIIKRGKMNCSWSSCRQGCTTQELFTCWQVLIAPDWRILNFTKDLMVNDVSVVSKDFYESTASEVIVTQDAYNDYADDRHTTPHSEVENRTVVYASALIGNNRIENGKEDYSDVTRDDDIHEEGDKNVEAISPSLLHILNFSFTEDNLARLKINAAGCGYSSCTSWWEEYGRIGTTFSCYIGALGQLAVPHVDAHQAAVQVTLGALPLVLCIASVPLIYRLYLRKGHTDHTLRLSPGPDAKKVKIEEARAKLLMEMAKGKKVNTKPKIADVFALAMKAKNMAKVRPLGGSSETLRFDDTLEEGENDSKNSNPLSKWRKVAIKAAAQHPSVSPARKFNEVEIDFTGE